MSLFQMVGKYRIISLCFNLISLSLTAGVVVNTLHGKKGHSGLSMYIIHEYKIRSFLNRTCASVSDRTHMAVLDNTVLLFVVCYCVPV